MPLWRRTRYRPRSASRGARTRTHWRRRRMPSCSRNRARCSPAAPSRAFSTTRGCTAPSRRSRRRRSSRGTASRRSATRGRSTRVRRRRCSRQCRRYSRRRGNCRLSSSRSRSSRSRSSRSRGRSRARRHAGTQGPAPSLPAGAQATWPRVLRRRRWVCPRRCRCPRRRRWMRRSWPPWQRRQRRPRPPRPCRRAISRP